MTTTATKVEKLKEIIDRSTRETGLAMWKLVDLVGEDAAMRLLDEVQWNPWRRKRTKKKAVSHPVAPS